MSGEVELCVGDGGVLGDGKTRNGGVDVGGGGGGVVLPDSDEV